MKSLNKNVLVIIIVITMLFCCLMSSFCSVLSFKYNNPHGHEISDEEILIFPENFLWGAATASYQVEGGNVNSSWWRFEQEEGRIKNGDRTDGIINHYGRYEEDFDLASKLSLNSYRFSIEWSRIEPQKGEFDEKEIEHYRDVLQALKDRDIKPMVTLWHHSVPAWFEDLGGWERGENVDYYTEYVNYVVANLSEEVELWLTMNEPMAYITCGYVSAKWPPAKQDLTQVPGLFSNLTLAHKEAYSIIHEKDANAQVGIAEHSSYIVPYHEKNILENIIASTIDYAWVHYLIDIVKDELDFIGVHYYYKQSINLSLAKDVLTKDPEEIENQSLDRAYYPEGLYEVLLKYKRYEKPIYITEIGVPDYHEIDRNQFIREHVREMYYAIQDGVDVRGFYYWSLLDCFEWSEGYDAEFGLIDVNLETQERTIKDESWEYALIAGCNCVYNDEL
ncbi:glycoside hydrolase family 1 protein [Candidatus Dojkabacteria bacterium]|nr:glycoside hydrolase family 1 protein [Candidatus Dojkabacteria bacterium]